MSRRHWLDLAEPISLIGSVAGSVMAVASQQVAYAAAPLTLAISLNWFNRHRLQQQQAQQVQQSTRNAITEIDQRTQALLAPQDARINDITQQLDSLTLQFSNLIIPAPVDISGIEEKITAFSSRLSILAQRVNSLNIPEPVNLSAIETDISNLNNQLGNLSREFGARHESQVIAQICLQLDDLRQQFSKRTELQTIEQVEKALPELSQRLDKLAISLEIDVIELEVSVAKISKALTAYAPKQKIDALTQHFTQEIEELKSAIADLPPPPQSFDPSSLITQIENLQQQLADVQESFKGLDKSAETLHDRTRNLAQMEQQLETLRGLSDGLNERRLDEIQQQLTSLRQLVNESVKTVNLNSTLAELSEKTEAQIDIALESRVAEINQLIKEIQPVYKYELVYERSGSRTVLMEALRTAQSQLILVCPWICCYGFNDQVISLCEALLRRGVKLEIGWGHLKDINDNKLGVGTFYNALDDLKNLRDEYPNLCKLKLLGTHEKFLVCDRSWAMLGSHNFLTSGDSSRERELGLRTNDPRIIADLLERFDRAEDLENQNSTNYKLDINNISF